MENNYGTRMKKSLNDFKSTLRGYKIFNDAIGELPVFLK